MKTNLFCLPLVAFCFLLPVLRVPATVYYVNASNPTPAAPFSTWATAATNIQDAIGVTSSGDLVLVTNGVYAYGGAVMAGTLSNRIALSNAITVQSVNGPWVTIIQGGGATNGSRAIRCAWLTNGAALVGFTLRGGATSTSGDSASLESGGGVWCASSNAVVENCLICSNTADYDGGGVYLGTLRNCAIYENNANFGGGSYASDLNNCTVTGNSANAGLGVPGGTQNCTMTNCIVYYNSPANTQNSVAGQISYCCTYPLPAGGTGNFTNPPQLFVDQVHLYPNSPCIGAGTNLGASTDIDGRPWANPPAVGCSGSPTVPFAGPPSIHFTTSPLGFAVSAAITGGGVLNCWWLENGTALQDDSQFTGTQTANLVVAGTADADAGSYQLVVSNAFGLATSAVVQVVIHCVDAAGTNPVAPYLDWSTAATNIQDAITAASVGEIVLATNGVYATGGKSMDGVITNRVSLDKAILLQSVNGAKATIIQGAWDPTATNGPGAIRCAWLTNKAILGGFTLYGGATRAIVNGSDLSGGGVIGSTNAVVSNCTLSNNAAATGGGGGYGLTLINCLLLNNRVLGIPGNGVTSMGGGADFCSLQNCTVRGNYAPYGGGTAYGVLKNCAVVGNSAGQEAGGAYYGTLVNCTVMRNQSLSTTYDFGGGAYSASLQNCIVYANQEAVSSGTASNYYNCTFSYSCSSPLPAGSGNIGADPQLLSDGIHLAPNSPCIGAGNASVVSGTDIDGQAWNNPPSIGCDEWQPAPLIVGQPSLQVGSPAQGLTCSVLVVGQSPFAFSWSQNGAPTEDDGHHSHSGSASLIVNHFGPADAGSYQVVVSNSFGAVTSAVLTVVIHAVNVAGANPVAPFSAWTTAATSVQEAINAAAAGDIVLVTNGLYATGGLVMAGDLTNRVALNKALTVISVNGWSATTIQGAWDPQTTNGPGAVRCAYVADGAVLNGFTLQNGATRNTGDAFGGGPLESGGGIWCNSINGMAVDCVLSNNAAIYGGGLAYGTLNNSLITGNFASDFGGAAYSGILNNCTVGNNYASLSGGGTYSSMVRNSIVIANYKGPGVVPTENNYFASGGPPQYFYSCTSPTLPGNGNTNVNPQFLDGMHLASTSPCRGAGSPQYATGTDVDGEAWANPPAMGCDEVILTNLIGPLSVNLVAWQTNVPVNRLASFWEAYTGRAATSSWSFGDGTTATNTWTNAHQWSSPGDFPVTYTVYNNDNPAGVAATVVIHVQALAIPQLQAPKSLTNGFQFQFAGQDNANYTIQYATNLVPPVAWQTLQRVFFNNQSVVQIVDGAWTNTARFYRVLAQ